MKYTRLYADAKGETHFENVKLELDEADYRPPAPLLYVSHAYRSNAIQFVRIPAGWLGKSFTVPQAQFLICLAGEVEVTASDGEMRTFRPGDTLPMQDTGGKGHTTRNRSAQDCVVAVAPVVS